MGKYEPLADYLKERRSRSWEARFSEVEQVLGFPLPRSARTYREWWANQRDGGHSQAKGWQAAGWRVWSVDLVREQVEFRQVPRAEDDDEALYLRASEYLGIADRTEVVREALRALVAREAGKQLIRLGGTMPNLKVPPRERPAL